MGDPVANFAQPRVASGALFADGRKVLLVRKTYGNQWDIPGGYVDRGESPAAACEREMYEELGLRRTAKRLLVNDWAPNDAEGDKLLYIFDCGELGMDERNIRVDGVEIEKVEWVPVGEVGHFLIPRLARRVEQAYRAHTSGVVLYLEHGRLRDRYLG
jgi:8-oxo-dGTP diphosphatase